MAAAPYFGQPMTAVALRPGAVAVPALASQVRPALVLPERETRELIAQARTYDVGQGGNFAAGPAGIQIWSGAFDGPGGSRGHAMHLGSVDWSYNTPVKHYATIYRAMVTAEGIAKQLNPKANLFEDTAAFLTPLLAKHIGTAV